jgi:hypothetical protein
MLSSVGERVVDAEMCVVPSGCVAVSTRSASVVTSTLRDAGCDDGGIVTTVAVAVTSGVMAVPLGAVPVESGAKLDTSRVVPVMSEATLVIPGAVAVTSRAMVVASGAESVTSRVTPVTPGTVPVTPGASVIEVGSADGSEESASSVTPTEAVVTAV